MTKWDKILFEFVFVIQCLSSVIFLFFGAVFFFLKDARSYLLGIIMVVVFLKMQKGDTGIKELIKSRKLLNKTLFDKEKINRRYSFVKKRELSSRYIRKKKAMEKEIKQKIEKIIHN